MIQIRPEMSKDSEAIYRLNRAVFEDKTEAELVDALRLEGVLALSLVAMEGDQLVGHIAFSPVISLVSHFSGLGLGPMAVSFDRQNQGIGAQLVRAGLQRCAAMDYDFIVVLGHPHFYPRFGFSPAKQYGIGCVYDVPDDVFMIQELKPDVLSNMHGIVQYHPLFG